MVIMVRVDFIAKKVIQQNVKVSFQMWLICTALHGIMCYRFCLYSCTNRSVKLNHYYCLENGNGLNEDYISHSVKLCAPSYTCTYTYHKDILTLGAHAQRGLQ